MAKKLNAGRGTIGKIAVIGFRERGGRVRAMILKSTRAENIMKAVRAVVTTRATLCTDKHASYRGMSEYAHKAVNHSAKLFVDGITNTSGIESVWAVLKRGFYGGYHFFSEKRLRRYIGEFSFRLNEGNCYVHSYGRMDALLGKTFGVRLTYKAPIA